MDVLGLNVAVMELLVADVGLAHGALLISVAVTTSLAFKADEVKVAPEPVTLLPLTLH